MPFSDEVFQLSFMCIHPNSRVYAGQMTRLIDPIYPEKIVLS